MLDAPAWRCRISLSLSLSSSSGLTEGRLDRARSRRLRFVPAGGGLSGGLIVVPLTRGCGGCADGGAGAWCAGAGGACARGSVACRWSGARGVDRRWCRRGCAAGAGGGDSAFAVVGGGGGGDRRAGLRADVGGADHARARVSRRTFYELFGNREACLVALLEEVVGRVERELEAAGLEGLAVA